ncbi:MAG: hypothetical protein ACOVNU_03545 [Candidatus Kapaibacteriota bacterium]|jgi:hypothetical protein
MAKTQTFGDKQKKGKVVDFIPVKVIKWYKDEDRSSVRSLERFVRIKELSELDKIDVTK